MILQRIGDGADARATARDRMRAVELRERHLSTANADPLMEELESWTEEELDRGLEDLLVPLDEDAPGFRV